MHTKATMPHQNCDRILREPRHWGSKRRSKSLNRKTKNGGLQLIELPSHIDCSLDKKVSSESSTLTILLKPQQHQRLGPCLARQSQCTSLRQRQQCHNLRSSSMSCSLGYGHP